MTYRVRANSWEGGEFTFEPPFDATPVTAKDMLNAANREAEEGNMAIKALWLETLNQYDEWEMIRRVNE